MDRSISVSENHDYIIIRVHKPMTTELSLRIGPEITRLAAEKSINRFLFDVRGSVNIQSVTKNFWFANKDIESFGFPRASRSAFLVDKNDRSHDFITTAFLNAGYIVRIFNDENSAIRWLEKGASIERVIQGS